MQFARPDNLWFLLLLLPMLLVYLGYWVWKQRKMKELGDHPLVEAMAQSRSARLQVARGVLVILSVALLVIASARPQWGQINRPIKRMGVDVVFALDLSRSMLARDATPSRLQAAKDEIGTTMQLLSGDRVGLVVFTAVSFAQSPLTTDYGAIRFYLDKLDPEQMPMGGTSVGRAMLDAVELLEAQSEKANAADNQVIVLITDGEDHESDPLGAAQVARDKGIHVVTVGIGSEAGERIPILNSDGSVAGFKRNRSGEIVRTRLDSKTLKDIASTTNGRYIHYSGQNSVANGVVEFVNELEKTELETLMRERYEDRFIWFVTPAFLFLLLAAGLGDRRRSKRAAVLTLVLGLSLVACDRPFEQPQDEVARANELVELGKFAEALDLYDEAQTKVPTTPELAYNRGRALLGLERWEEAQQAFAKGLESEDPGLRFDANANLGLALAGQEKWAEAYEAFRAALRIAGRHPGQIDDERIARTRRDLEVAFRKLFPPCSSLEDDREEDDTFETAEQLEGGQAEDLTLCGLDDDWILVPAIPGTTVSVTATFEDLRDEPDPEQIFARRPSDIQLALLSGDGGTVLAVDQGEQKTFDPDARRATRSIEKFMVEPEMVKDSPGIFVKVKAAEALEFSYDLSIESIPPCYALQEDSEPNNAPENAFAIPTEVSTETPLSGHLCDGDDDWYAFDVEIGDALFFDVIAREDQETGKPPELEIALLDADSGDLISDGVAEAGLYTVGSRLFTAAKRVLLRVRGAGEGTQGPYSVVPYHYPPCIVGDDRYEDNDEAANPHELDPSLPIHRYLRICDNDPDFFRIPFPEAQKDDKDSDSDDSADPPTGDVKLGLSQISTIRRDGPTDTGSFTLDLMSETGDQILAEGTAPGPRPPSTKEAPPMPLARALFEDDVEGESALIRVTGEPDFYHLVQLNPQKPPQQQEQQEDQKKEQDQQDNGDQGEQQEQKQDGQSGDEQESDQQDQGDGADKGDGEEEPEEGGAPNEPEETQSGEDEQEAPAPGEEESDEEVSGQQQPAEAGDKPGKKRMEAILDALEKSDDNFQMKKALEKVPGRFIEKDW